MWCCCVFLSMSVEWRSVLECTGNAFLLWPTQQSHSIVQQYALQLLFVADWMDDNIITLDFLERIRRVSSWSLSGVSLNEKLCLSEAEVQWRHSCKRNTKEVVTNWYEGETWHAITWDLIWGEIRKWWWGTKTAPTIDKRRSSKLSWNGWWWCARLIEFNSRW